MEDGGFPPNSMAMIDSDFMDELLTDGCWIDTTGSSDFLFPSPPTSAANFDSPSFMFPTEIFDNLDSNPSQSLKLDENTKSLQLGDQNLAESQSANQRPNLDKEAGIKWSTGCEETILRGHGIIYPLNESSRRWWIEPQVSPGPNLSVKQRLLQALNYIKESARDGEVLVQIWVPVRNGGRNVLTTDNQLFWHNSRSQSLVNYREASKNYQFPAEENSNAAVGLPGRVFSNRLPEWTPDVGLFRKDEYPRIGHAVQNGVQGSIALPVFEQGSRACLGVVEVVMTTRMINYRPELESICSALQAVNLRSSEVTNVPRRLDNDQKSYKVALPEILELLKAVCETHRLPLAQTWVPCVQQGKRGSRHSDESYVKCISTVDVACYVKDPSMWGFHEACSEHHLLKGQGVSGEAFTKKEPCFSTDITAFSKSEYPLSHYAQLFGLRAAVAIRLRCIHTGSLDYVLEFFLPVECREGNEQRQMLNSLSVIIQQVCKSLRVLTDKEIQDEKASSVTGGSRGDIPSNDSVHNAPSSINVNGKIPHWEKSASLTENYADKAFCISSQPPTQDRGKNHLDPNSLPGDNLNQNSVCQNLSLQCNQNGEGNAGFRPFRLDNSKHTYDVAGPSGGKVADRRRTKMEKNISLEILRQYFAGSLKDAAKSIGVCPTTLKRICRQHGISRWPSRKIKKVGHSLKKLQVVIESVHGAESAFQMSSLYTNFPKTIGSDIASSKISGGTSTINQSENPSHNTPQNHGAESAFQMSSLYTNFPKTIGSDIASSKISGGTSTINQSENPSHNTPQNQGALTCPATSNSPSSSCSQSSSSSLCCSSGARQSTNSSLPVAIENAAEKSQSGMLKRAYSEAELSALIKEETKLPYRSISQKLLTETHPLERSASVPKNIKHSSRVGVLRVKAAYGEEKVRFSLKPTCCFQDLVCEVMKRFDLVDMSVVDIKYLDDDSEWVLLTCDADLEECKDIYKSSRAHSIKLSVHNKQLNKSSLGSTCLLE